MPIEYFKLVRDHIPALIRQHGDSCDITIMDECEYQEALRKKLVEEAQEVAVASADELITELADLYEVVETLIRSYQIEPEVVRATQERRRKERGGFEQRICLLRTYTSDEQATE